MHGNVLKAPPPMADRPSNRTSGGTASAGETDTGPSDPLPDLSPDIQVLRLADRARDADLRHAARLLNVFQRQMRVRDDRRNPVLARSLTGRHAPDAAGAPPGARVAPAAQVAPAQRKIVEENAETMS